MKSESSPNEQFNNLVCSYQFFFLRYSNFVVVVDSKTFDEFKTILCHSKLIINRDHFGFPLLFKALVSNSDVSPLRHQKLGLLITGRAIDHPEVELWANGNVWNQWKKVVHGGKYFDEATERKIIEIAEKFAKLLFCFP